MKIIDSYGNELGYQQGRKTPVGLFAFCGVLRSGCDTGYKINSDGTIMKSGNYTSVSLSELLG